MATLDALGLGRRIPNLPGPPNTEYVMVQSRFRRLLAFRNRTIHDIVNNPIVKNEMLGYWKVFKQIERHGEVLELERQWNALGHRI